MKTHLRFDLLLLAGCVALVMRAADSQTSLNGTWKPSEAELGGQLMPPPVFKSITLKLEGADYEVDVVTPKGVAVDKGTIALDEAAKPKGMTIRGISGPNAGKVYPCIYTLEGDTLRICYDLSGTKRPAEFKTLPGTLHYLVTYERSRP